MDLLRRAPLIHFTIVGALVGVIGAVGWRHGTRRTVFVENLPPANPGDKGVLFTFDHLQHLSGPRWWPELLVLPMTGIVVALTAGLVCTAVRRSAEHRPADWLGSTVPAAIAGAAVALAAILLTHIDRPSELVRIVPYSSSASTTSSGAITGEPWSHELVPAAIWFPAIGIVTAIALSALLRVRHHTTRWRIGHTRRRHG
ncbi:hypothetical protein ACXVUM_09930 [Williamsia sp. SKLECPSW1]